MYISGDALLNSYNIKENKRNRYNNYWIQSKKIGYNIQVHEKILMNYHSVIKKELCKIHRVFRNDGHKKVTT